MPYDPEKHHRRSIRLKGYDYSQAGAYFVTICTHDRECLFGEINQGEMAMNPCGRIVHEEWVHSAQIRHEIRLDESVVMPNHVHGIVFIIDDGSRDVGATGRSPLRTMHPPSEPIFRPGPPKESLGSFIAGFKPAVTQWVNQMRGTPGLPVWQRNYHEHIIRYEDELNQIRAYIRENPLRWETDENYPHRLQNLQHQAS